MKRSEAGRLLDTADYLTLSERVVYLILLERSDNDDCKIPPRMAPRIAAIAHRGGMSTRSVRRALSHLMYHGFLIYSPGRGRGHLGVFTLAPREPPHQPDATCQCLKADSSVPLPVARKGDSSVPLPARKGDRSDTEKGTRTLAPSQVKPCVPRRDAVTGGVVEGSHVHNVQPATPDYTDNEVPTTATNTADTCTACGKASGFSLIGGVCRRCHFRLRQAS